MRKNIINLENHGLRELDRIVVNVLDAVETEVRNRLGLDDYWEATAETEENQNLSADQPTSEEESVAGPTARVMHKRHTANGRRKDPEVIAIDKLRAASRPQKPQSVQWDHFSPELETELTQSDEVLFDKEEEAFIAQCVKFLRPRDNKDVIISRIWNHITDSEPDAFYSPAAEDAQETPEEEMPAPEDISDPESQHPQDKLEEDKIGKGD